MTTSLRSILLTLCCCTGVTAQAADTPATQWTYKCTPNAVVPYDPYYQCEEALRPPDFVVDGLPPMIGLLGSEDPSITVESLKTFHEDLQKAGMFRSSTSAQENGWWLRVVGSHRPDRRTARQEMLPV